MLLTTAHSKYFTALCIVVYGVSLFSFTHAGPLIDPPMYGINLGGWFILERFLNPSILQYPQDPRVVDEWTYTQYHKNDPEMVQRLENHWDAWVTEEEIQKLATIGFTHVRIPIGYWAFMTQAELDSYNEPFLTGKQWGYMQRCIGWLKQRGMKAIVDLHGAPGSQNGWDNSGRVMREPQWTKGDNIARTVEIIGRMSQRVLELEDDEETSGVVVGIDVLNEPFPHTMNVGGMDAAINVIKDYYQRAYNKARTILKPENYSIVIDYAFCYDCWKNFMPLPQYLNVWFDLHVYHCFEPGLRSAPMQEHLRIACQDSVEKVDSQTLPSFVGEWSVAWKVESDFAHLEPFPNPTEQEFMLEFGMSQMRAYGSFFFWNFKTEEAPMWSYFLGEKEGWLPSTLPTPEIANTCNGAQRYGSDVEMSKAIKPSSATSDISSSTTAETTSSSSSSSSSEEKETATTVDRTTADSSTTQTNKTVHTDGPSSEESDDTGISAPQTDRNQQDISTASTVAFTALMLLAPVIIAVVL